MTSVIVAIHLLLAISMIGIVLIQQSEGGGLGIGGGGGGGGMGGFMTSRSTANMLTRTTAILAALFFVTSMTLAILANSSGREGSILDRPEGIQTAPNQSAPANQTPTPSIPSLPQVPGAPGK
jgi:preprotein translocase subunit SecG